MILKFADNNFMSASELDNNAIEFYTDHKEGLLKALEEFAKARGFERKDDIKSSATSVDRIYYNKKTPAYSSSLFLRNLDRGLSVVINCSKNKMLPSIAKSILWSEFSTEKLERYHNELCD